MSAVQQVFDTPELSEAILLQLPMLDILCAQRISKQWQATINGSILLQRKLFFTSERGELLHLHVRHLKPGDCIAYRHSRHVRHSLKEAFLYHESFPLEPVVATRNPVIERLERQMDEYLISKTLAANRGRLLPEVWIRREASWRRMLLSQPRIESVLWITLKNPQEDAGGCRDTAFNLRVSDSLQFSLGEVLDEIHSGDLAKSISNAVAKGDAQGYWRPPYTRLSLDIEGL